MQEKSKSYYYLSIIFIFCILISNIVAGRTFPIEKFQIPSSTILFPISFIVGDILTELFGFKASLKVFCVAFILNIFMVGFFMIVNILPVAEPMNIAEAYKIVLYFSPRLLAGSLVGFLVGNITNSLIMVSLKKLTKSRFLWVRTILSTIVGEFLDTACFVFIAFIGVLSSNALWNSIWVTAIMKILYEIIFTPIVYYIIHKYNKYHKVKEEQI